MVNKIECAGGTVVKEGEKKWQVYAPDNRPVGSFPTKKQALAKAESWDKWDAFDSLQDICFAMSPFTMMLMAKVLNSIGKDKMWMPTDEQLRVAITVDFWLRTGRQLIAEGKISEEDFMKATAEVVKKVIDEKVEAKTKKEKNDGEA